MTVKRQKRSGSYKFKVALEAMQGLKTVNQIASEYQVSPSQVSEWKKELQSQGASLFEAKGARREGEQEQREAELYEQIGRLKMELEWLKKKV